MVAAQLVERDIKDGETLLRRLDGDGFPVSAALWFYYSEYEKWSLIIASALVGTQGPIEAYKRLLKSLKRIRKHNFCLDSSRIELVKENDRIPKALRHVIQTGRGISGIRYTRNTINGFFVEDAYIYRAHREQVP